jgi:hypothetical protein
MNMISVVVDDYYMLLAPPIMDDEWWRLESIFGVTWQTLKAAQDMFGGNPVAEVRRSLEGDDELFELVITLEDVSEAKIVEVVNKLKEDK